MRHLHSLLDDAVDTFDASDSHPPEEFPVTYGADAAGVAPMRFRAATVDEALEDATTQLGRPVEILEANRIRRGGVAGFFATDLGVEIVVTPTDTAAPTGRLGVPAAERANSATPVRPATPPVRRAQRPQPSIARPAALGAKPQFYDRLIEEPDDEFASPVGRNAPAPRTPRPAATGIDSRSTPRPTGTERPAEAERPVEESAARRRSLDETVAALTSDETAGRSFASHFARQMAMDVTDPNRSQGIDELQRLLEQSRPTPQAETGTRRGGLGTPTGRPGDDELDEFVDLSARELAALEPQLDETDDESATPMDDIVAGIRSEEEPVVRTRRRGRRASTSLVRRPGARPLAEAPNDTATASPTDIAAPDELRADPRAEAEARVAAARSADAELSTTVEQVVSDATATGVPETPEILETTEAEVPTVATAEAAPLDSPEPAETTPTPVPADPTTELATSARTAPADGDTGSLRRPTEVVAGAVEALVGQLSDTAPVAGSRMNDLRRLKVRLTTGDGDVIEMTAELGGR